ncbi:hypothetical protein ABTB51_20360, partial [Acinetobacter baumannii]
ETVATFDAESVIGKPEKFGFVLESDRDVIVAFRGTSSTAEWISDAIARQTKFKYVRNSGQTHQGITGIYASARRPV